MSEEARTESNAEAAETVGFPCRSCGSQMAFSPARGKLYCSYCESEQEIDSPAIEAPEYFYYPQDDRYEAPNWEEMGSKTLTCPSCGADTVMGAAAMTATCPFCGSHYVAEAQPMPGIILPETMMPFRISREAAVERFGVWAKKRWLAPRKFRKSRHTLEPNGIYIPFWTFDAQISTSFRGFGGRRRVVRYTVRVNGRTQTRTKTVIDWYPISGSETKRFDDIPCVASANIDTSMLKKVGPYSMKVLHVYNPAYLAGLFAERYSISLRQGFESIRASLERDMVRQIERRCGYDLYRDMHYHHHYDEVRFKHILLPLWLSAYRYRNKVYQLMINGETGQVAGKSPISALKIALLVMLGILALGGLIFGMMALGGDL